MILICNGEDSKDRYIISEHITTEVLRECATNNIPLQGLHIRKILSVWNIADIDYLIDCNINLQSYHNFYISNNNYYAMTNEEDEKLYKKCCSKCKHWNEYVYYCNKRYVPSEVYDTCGNFEEIIEPPTLWQRIKSCF